MTKNLELTKLNEWDILELVNEKIVYYQKLKQEWTGDKDDDFDMDIWCDTRIGDLTELKNKFI
tara:strand:- start:874 stop:1062 length:189 start_codon:yes stop_codon:yes gene_type:complete